MQAAADIDTIDSEVRSALAGNLDLPVLPTVVTEILASSADDDATADSDYDPAHLAQVIQQDQTVASHVLRVVNSPLYQGTQKIVALQQAIARLGLNTLREIAITASMANQFACKAYEDLARGYWRDALGAALWSKEVARASRTNVEVSYLSGLLHNIGAPLVVQCVANLGYRDLAEADMRAIVNPLVPTAGISLCEAWDMPGAVHATITHVHAPEEATDYESIVACVALGIRFAAGAADDAFDPASLAGSTAGASLSLYPDHLAELWDARERIGQSIGLLG